jgi:PTS system mannose-specific IIB component
MAIENIRIDDRLIHGQILVAWARALSLDTLVVVSDEVAGNEVEKELVSASAPEPFVVEVLSIAEAAEKINAGAYNAKKAMIILPSAQEALRLLDAGATMSSVSVGGIHFSEGRRRILPYLYLDDEEEQALRGIASRGVTIEIQDVPANRKWVLEDLVGAEGGRDDSP